MAKAKTKTLTDPAIFVEPIAVSISFGCHLLGISRSSGYKEIRAGRLHPTRMAGKPNLTMAELRRYAAAAESASETVAA